jgi:hypothetical protein
VNVDFCLSIPENFTNTIRIYPNPSSGQFQFSSSVFPIQLSIYDALGRLIIEQIVQSSNEILLIENPGVYLVRIEQDGREVSSGKLVITTP